MAQFCMIADKSNMDLSAGFPFPLIKSGLLNEYPFLDKDIKTDVLVLGGGISGALMLYYLAKAGVDCTLIDGRTIGLGSSCASTSLLQYEIDTPLTELTQMIGKQHAFDAYLLSSQAIDKLEVIAGKIGFDNFQRKQSLYYAAKKKDVSFLEKEFELRKEAGFDLRFLYQAQIENKFGFTAPAALLSKQGAQTNAYEFTHALLQYVIKKGVPVYDRTEAISIKHGKDKVLLTTDKGYKIQAKKVIYATGYEVVKYIKEKIVKLQSTYAICSEQMKASDLKLLAGSLIWNTADPYLYMRLTSDSRILIGGRDEEFYNPKKREALLRSKTRQLTNDFRKLFPEILFQPEFSWTGTFGSTKDGLPYIGPYKKLANSYFSLGFGGNGITFSLIGAEMISNMITGRKNIHEDIFSFNRI